MGSLTSSVLTTITSGRVTAVVIGLNVVLVTQTIVDEPAGPTGLPGDRARLGRHCRVCEHMFLLA
jgi:hypothetical protein